MERTRPWELSEEVWQRAEPLLPARKPRPKGGRPPRSDREMLRRHSLCVAHGPAMECPAARDRGVDDGV